MTKKSRDLVKEKKEKIVYVLFYSLLVSLLLKIVLGFLFGSNCLLVSGNFSALGLFVVGVSLIRINRAHPARRMVVTVNSDKLQFAIILGISALIALSTGFLLFSIGHMVLSDVLYPPEMAAGWTAIGTGVLDLLLLSWIKNKVADVPEMDEKEIFFILDTDFLLSVLVCLTVVVSRMGSALVDYACAVFSAFFLIVYCTAFLLTAFKGLMDVSSDAKTTALVHALIHRARTDLSLVKLRVHQTGPIFKINMTLGLSGDAPAKEAAGVIEDIRETFRREFRKPHELFVGITSLDKI